MRRAALLGSLIAALAIGLVLVATRAIPGIVVTPPGISLAAPTAPAAAQSPRPGDPPQAGQPNDPGSAATAAPPTAQPTATPVPLPPVPVPTDLRQIAAVLALAPTATSSAPVTTPVTTTTAVAGGASPTAVAGAATAAPTTTAATTATAAANPTANPTAAASPTAALAANKELSPGGWTVRAPAISLRSPGYPVALVPEVEIAPLDKPFGGSPTVRGAPLVPPADPAAQPTVVQPTAIALPIQSAATAGTPAAQATQSAPPTAAAQPASTGQTAAGQAANEARIELPADLTPGQYHWRARLVDPTSGKASDWVEFAAGKVAFGLAGPTPKVADLAVVDAKTVGGAAVIGAKDQPKLSWSVPANAEAFLDQVLISIDQAAAPPPSAPADARKLPADARTTDLGPLLGTLPDGKRSVRVWAVDKLGRVGEPASVPIDVERIPPQVQDVVFRSWATNPAYQQTPIKFKLNKPADVKVLIFSSAGAIVRTYPLPQQTAGGDISLKWDGKDSAGQVVKPGDYSFEVQIEDSAGNTIAPRYLGLVITDKVIQVSLGKQSLTAIAGTQPPYLTTPITSGGQALPTPAGTFEILSKESPFTFHAPYDRSSPNWYADITARQAMLFYPQDADFIHDAPWRSTFGPGSNGPGIPGSTFTGSHGCVELPAGTMPKLFEWTPLGTPVVITQ